MLCIIICITKMYILLCIILLIILVLYIYYYYCCYEKKRRLYIMFEKGKVILIKQYNKERKRAKRGDDKNYGICKQRENHFVCHLYLRFVCHVNHWIVPIPKL